MNATQVCGRKPYSFHLFKWKEMNIFDSCVFERSFGAYSMEEGWLRGKGKVAQSGTLAGASTQYKSLHILCTWPSLTFANLFLMSHLSSVSSFVLLLNCVPINPQWIIYYTVNTDGFVMAKDLRLIWLRARACKILFPMSFFCWWRLPHPIVYECKRWTKADPCNGSYGVSVIKGNGWERAYVCKMSRLICIHGSTPFSILGIWVTMIGPEKNAADIIIL